MDTLIQNVCTIQSTHLKNINIIVDLYFQDIFTLLTGQNMAVTSSILIW